MKSNKIILILAALLLCVVFTLGGCGPKPNPDGNDQNNTPPASNGDNNSNNDSEATEMYITVNGNKLTVTLVDNAATRELVALLQQGDVTFTVSENGGFEMYGDLGHTLTKNDAWLTAQSGDVLLYSGKYLCFFFGSNAYYYTKIGVIAGYTAQELRTMLYANHSTAQVTISLNAD